MSASATPMSQDRDLQLAIGIATAVVKIFNVVIRDLDAAGITSKDRLADDLEQASKEDREPHLATTDLAVFRLLGKALRAPPASAGVWDTAKWGE